MDPTVRTRPVPPPRFSTFSILLLFAGILAFSLATILAVSTWREGKKLPPKEIRVVSTDPPSASDVPTATAVVSASIDPPDASAADDEAGGKFDRDAARAAIDAVAPKLGDCKLPKGKSVRVKVTFAPQGTVSSANVLAPWAARSAPCVAGHVKEATIRPFQGAANTAVYILAVPK
jgi:hypothetical protein